MNDLNINKEAISAAEIITVSIRCNPLNASDVRKEVQLAINAATDALERENASLRAELFRLREAASKDKAVLTGPLHKSWNPQ